MTVMSRFQATIVLSSLILGLVQRVGGVSQFSDSWEYPINGHEPAGAGPFPLFIWLQGTSMDQNGPNTDSFTSYAANHGVVGAAVHYFNGFNSSAADCGGCYPFSCDAFLTKAEEIFSTANASSAVSVLCARENVDCSLGVIIAGFSQGANLASLSANFVDTFEISAVYEMAGGDGIPDFFLDFSQCLSFDALSWSQSQIRAVTGERDEFFGLTEEGVRDQLISITGRSCANTTFDCIGEDGSGWYIVQDSEVANKPGNATHCLSFEGEGLCDAVLNDEYAVLCGADCKWSFVANMDWLLSTLNLPTTDEPTPNLTMQPTDDQSDDQSDAVTSALWLAALVIAVTVMASV